MTQPGPQRGGLTARRPRCRRSSLHTYARKDICHSDTIQTLCILRFSMPRDETSVLEAPYKATQSYKETISEISVRISRPGTHTRLSPCRDGANTTLHAFESVPTHQCKAPKRREVNFDYQEHHEFQAESILRGERRWGGGG